MKPEGPLPRLYRELASWWPLLSAPAEYAEEAAVYAATLTGIGSAPLVDVLELGCGGGNNASHLKERFAMTLVDLSPAMLAVSRALNPECDHVVGDMRSVRLDQTFDAVFVHDAVEYLTSEADLDALAATIRTHLRPGGVALVVPDQTAEYFEPGTDHGGHDGDGRALRYLEWTWDPDPTDTTYIMDMVYALREGDEVEVVHDRHVLGTFPEPAWRHIFGSAGFDVSVDRVESSGGEWLTQIVLRS